MKAGIKARRIQYQTPHNEQAQNYAEADGLQQGNCKDSVPN